MRRDPIPVLLVCFALALPALAQPPREEKADLSVAADRTAYEPGETARIAAKVTVEEGWHVNSNTPTFDYLIPTKLNLELPAGWPDEYVRYPKHEMKTFAFADQPLAVYDGELVILSEVKLPADAQKGSIPVRAALRYQACNDSQCLPPVTTHAQLVLTVGPGGTPIESELFPRDASAVPESAGGPGRGLRIMLLL